MLKRYLIPILLLLISGEFSLAGSPCYNLQITELSSRQALLFGVEVELERLSEVIEETSENDGAIFYYRKNELDGQSELLNKIIDLAFDNEAPIKLSKEADFSDVLYPDGNAR